MVDYKINKNYAVFSKIDSMIFDNGQGLLQNFSITPPFMEIEEKEERLVAASISGSFECQFCVANNYHIGQPMYIDYEKFYKILEEKYPEKSIAKDFIINQLEKYKTIFQKKELFHEKEKDNERDNSYKDLER